MAKEKAIAKKQTHEVAEYHEEKPEVLRTDIIVPYLVTCQGLSEAVIQRKAQLGDIVKSTSFEKAGDTENPVEVIFLHYPKMNWIVEKKNVKGKFEYVRTEPRNAKNDTDSWSYFCDENGVELPEFKKGAIEYRRVKQLLAFAILSKDIVAAEAEMKKIEDGDLPDPSKALTPVLVSFRSTSYKAGREVCSFYTRADSMRVPIWRYSLALSNASETNDEGTFYVWKVDSNKPKAVPKEHIPLVERWVGLVTAGGLRADDQAEREASKPTSIDQNAEEVC